MQMFFVTEFNNLKKKTFFLLLFSKTVVILLLYDSKYKFISFQLRLFCLIMLFRILLLTIAINQPSRLLYTIQKQH